MVTFSDTSQKIHSSTYGVLYVNSGYIYLIDKGKAITHMENFLENIFNIIIINASQEIRQAIVQILNMF